MILYLSLQKNTSQALNAGNTLMVTVLAKGAHYSGPQLSCTGQIDDLQTSFLQPGGRKMSRHLLKQFDEASPKKAPILIDQLNATSNVHGNVAN